MVSPFVHNLYAVIEEFLGPGFRHRSVLRDDVNEIVVFVFPDGLPGKAAAFVAYCPEEDLARDKPELVRLFINGLRAAQAVFQ